MFELSPVNPSSDHAKAIEGITACHACAEVGRRCKKACRDLLAE